MWVRRVEKAGVKVLLNTEATPEYVKEFAPDALFVAIGSNELRPPIKGMDGDNVIMAIDAELHPEKLGERVAIGDCRNVGQIYHAMTAGYYAARTI